MKTIGLLTQDFTSYYDLVKHLKEHDVAFLSLAFNEPVPPGVGVVVTTPGEAGRVAFPDVVLHRGDPRATVDIALQVLQGRPQYGTVVVGVDPGERPGIAIFGDGRLLRVEQVMIPELVVDEVARAMQSLSAEHFIVRVGHGAGTLRDRILNELLRSDKTSRATIEMVDETRTSPIALRDQLSSDIAAAKAIAMARGRPVKEFREIRPSEGEMRDVQRKSRIASGDVTISRDLAREVVRGSLTLEQAIARQRGERTT